LVDLDRYTISSISPVNADEEKLLLLEIKLSDLLDNPKEVAEIFLSE
jgi:hypothetical protein